jgi:GNAT superfamily N-acetyltransferase
MIDVTFDDYLMIYELLRKKYKPEWIRPRLYGFGMSKNLVNDEVIGVAFFWHIEDPFDIENGKDPNGCVSMNGKYLYFQEVYVARQSRENGVMAQLVKKAFDTAEEATRMCIYKRKKLKILNETEVQELIGEDHG